VARHVHRSRHCLYRPRGDPARIDVELRNKHVRDGQRLGDVPLIRARVAPAAWCPSSGAGRRRCRSARGGGLALWTDQMKRRSAVSRSQGLGRLLGAGGNDRKRAR
jgi:hypothetical protein